MHFFSLFRWLQKNQEFLLTNLEYNEYHRDVSSLDIEVQRPSPQSAAPKINHSKQEASSESSVETAKYILSNQKTKRKRQTSTNIRVKVKQFNSINDNDNGNREEMKLIKSSKLAKNSSAIENNNKYPTKNLRRKIEAVEGKCNVDDNIGRERKLRRKVEPVEDKYKESKIKVKKRRLKRKPNRCDSSTVSQKYNLKTYKRNQFSSWDLE
jgi:hypothetical protein